MADKNRSTFDIVGFFRDLSEHPYRYDFFAAVRKIECLYREAPPLGRSLHADDDRIRLGQDPHLEFAPATLASCSPAAGKRRPRIGGYFLGLFGPNGPLPLHLTDYARHRARHEEDPTFSRFADMFHHRFLSLFYRAWAMAQPSVSYDRPDADRFGAYVASLTGLGLPSLRDRDAMPDAAKLHFAGLLACQSRNPEGLRQIIEAFFEMPVRIEEFVGGWMVLPTQLRWRLGTDPSTGTLGASTTVGRRAWGCHQKFRVVLGPMGLADYRRLLPGGDSLSRLVAIVRNYVGEELQWDVNLILEREQVPALRLGQAGQLGWTTWLDPRRKAADADDLRLRPAAHVARSGRGPAAASTRGEPAPVAT